MFARLFRRKPRIFVQIASYRDEECQWTIRDMFLKAAHPERVFAGICWQFDAEADQHCFAEPSPRPKQVRLKSVRAQDSRGVCWARAEAQKLYRGEEYVLMIDSHMRFVPDWDELLIDELHACGNPKAILSSYPPGYTPPDALEPLAKPSVQRLNPPDEQGDIRGHGERLEHFPPQPLRGAFIAAGLLFARGSLLREVPYDPHMYFNQEEISLAARFYTHGWDVYHPARLLVYHYYKQPGDKTHTRPLHWEDNKDWLSYQQRARKRLWHLVGHKESTEADVLKELKYYGLGKARSLQEFEQFTGVDFASMTVSEKAQKAGFIEGLDRYRKQPGAAIAINSGKPGLKPGDILPARALPDQYGKPKELASYKGKPLLLFFLPDNFPAFVDEFFDYAIQHKRQLGAMSAHKVIVVPGGAAQALAVATQYGRTGTFLADEGGELARCFSPHHPPFTVWIDSEQKISQILDQRNAQNHLADVMRLPIKTATAAK